jgi:hypothetical protein
MWYTGQVKTPRVSEGPSQVQATASTPLYLSRDILPQARRLVKWAYVICPGSFIDV